MEFSVCYQFAVQRRIPWDDDRDALRKHVNDVRSRLAGHHSVEDVRTTSDLSTANLTVEFVIFGSNRQSVEIELLRLLGDAIRGSGAYHKGLLPAADEIRLRPRVNTWSGLRTPTWRVRRSSVSLKRSLGVASAAE